MGAHTHMQILQVYSWHETENQTGLEMFSS